MLSNTTHDRYQKHSNPSVHVVPLKYDITFVLHQHDQGYMHPNRSKTFK